MRFGKKGEDLFFKIFWKGSLGNHSMGKSQWKAHSSQMPKPTNFWIGTNFLYRSKQQGSVWLRKNEVNSKIIYTSFRGRNPISDEHNLYQVFDCTWKSPLLSRLTNRNHGLTVGGIPVCFALSGPTTLKFGNLEDESSSTELRIKIDLLITCFPLGLAMTWDIRTNWALLIFSLLLPSD